MMDIFNAIRVFFSRLTAEGWFAIGLIAFVLLALAILVIGR